MKKDQLFFVHQAPCRPGLRLFELSAPVEAIFWLTTAHPLLSIIAHCLLERDVFTCFPYPGYKTRPFTDDRLMADLERSYIGNIIGHEQTRDDEGINGLAHQMSLLCIIKHKSCECRTPACGIMLCGSWLV